MRTVYAEVPPRVDYALTALGHSLEPVLLAMRDWGTAYRQGLQTDARSPTQVQPACPSTASAASPGKAGSAAKARASQLPTVLAA